MRSVETKLEMKKHTADHSHLPDESAGVWETEKSQTHKILMVTIKFLMMLILFACILNGLRVDHIVGFDTIFTLSQ